MSVTNGDRNTTVIDFVCHQINFLPSCRDRASRRPNIVIESTHFDEKMLDGDKQNPRARNLIIVDYHKLIDRAEKQDQLQDKLENAFGLNGIGIIGIRNVPDFVEAKRELLSLAYPLANLPEQELKNLEAPETLYNTGWSHGKETLKHGSPDWNKASFYFNPLIDEPGTEEERKNFPLSYPSNRWPKASSLPTFKTAARRLGSLMKDVAVELSKHIDDYAKSKNSSYRSDTLYRSLANTEKVKGRLLYYYPLIGDEKNEQSDNDQSEDSWIGWHNDSGFLTCLSGGLFMEPDGTILPSSPYNNAGLYVADRNNEVFKVQLPGDCMAIQIGECTQILTGGEVIATPHCVKGAPNVARTSFACFIDTPPTYALKAPPSKSVSAGYPAFSSARVPPLSKRWHDGMLFGEFLDKTFKSYYCDSSSVIEENSN